MFLHAVIVAGGQYRLIQPFRLSLLNYEEDGPPLPGPTNLDFKEIHFVGIGAIGSATVYALAHFPRLRGLFHAIDNDDVDTTNLQRYILMRHDDVGRSKASVAVQILKGHGADAKDYRMPFDEFRRLHPGPIELLLTPVDSEAGRRALASHLPRAVLNAATGHSKVTVSRHGFADGKACLRCLYLPRAEETTTEQRLANDLGLPIHEVVDYLVNNRGVDHSLARRVEQHRSLEEGRLSAWVGQPIQSFYQRAVCGEAAVRTAAGSVISPLSFISAAAGIMLAAELVKACVTSLSRFQLDNYFRIDAMSTPNPSFKAIKPKTQPDSAFAGTQTTSMNSARSSPFSASTETAVVRLR